MLFSRTWQHAMRLLLQLARLGPGEQVGAHAVAETAGVPAHYAAKVLGILAAAGLVRGQRGPRGGVRLARPPDAISLADVARALGAEPDPDGCLIGHDGCSDAEPCAVRPTWRLIAAVLGRTLADVASPAAAASPGGRDPAPDARRFVVSSDLDDELL